jgi:hypothetical protein
LLLLQRLVLAVYDSQPPPRIPMAQPPSVSRRGSLLDLRRLKAFHPEKVHTLCKMHLSFLLDLPGSSLEQFLGAGHQDAGADDSLAISDNAVSSSSSGSKWFSRKKKGAFEFYCTRPIWPASHLYVECMHEHGMRARLSCTWITSFKYSISPFNVSRTLAFQSVAKWLGSAFGHSGD